MNRTSWTIILIIGGVMLTTLTIYWPSVLAENSFLKSFVTHELLSLLVVILTITFASVANIHLTISRVQTTIKSAEERDNIERQFARPLQEETRSSAMLLFWTFVSSLGAVLIKGEWDSSQYVLSATHGVGVLATIINVIVLYDIYGTIFALVGVGGHDHRGDTDYPNSGA